MAQAGPRRRGALIVESDGRTGELGAAMFGEFGLDVRRVESARAAIAHLVDRPGEIQVVLTGTMAGELDGAALARRIGVLWPTISVIVTSDAPPRPGEDRPVRATYLPTPCPPLEIVSVAEKAARANDWIGSVAL